MEIRVQWSDNGNELQQLQNELLQVIEGAFGPPLRQNFAWVMRDDAGILIGGVAGYVHWQWAYISQLWVHPNHQGQGHAKKLLEQVETWSKQNNFIGIYIDTFDGRVKEFYERRGFQVCGQIPDFPPGHQRTYLCRRCEQK
jgi:GNAT superfamily N-acetyltransferase